MTIKGPAIILNSTSTILIEPNCQSYIDQYGNIEILIEDTQDENDCKTYKTVE